MKVTKINLYCLNNYRNDDEVAIIFEVVNITNAPIQVLKWYTPLEGLRSSCLVVKSGGKVIPYDGIKVKRGAPTANDFIELQPEEGISQKVNLEQAYNIPLDGAISVDFDDSSLLVSNSINKARAEDFYQAAKKARIKKYDINNCKFRLHRSKKLYKTKGQEVRGKQKSALTGVKAVKDPKTEGMNEEEKKKVKAAYSNGYALASASLSGLANDDKYKKWFGGYTNARYAKVKDVFTKVKKGLEATQFTYVKNGPDCEAGDVAYTYNGSDKVWICNVFWSLNPIGLNSQAGTVIHEHSHASAGTGDYAYGVDDCTKLAKDKPDQAIDNGDNYEYYSES